VEQFTLSALSSGSLENGGRKYPTLYSRDFPTVNEAVKAGNVFLEDAQLSGEHSDLILKYYPIENLNDGKLPKGIGRHNEKSFQVRLIKNLDERFGPPKTLAELLAESKQELAEIQARLASLVKVQREDRKMEHNERNMVTDFRSFIGKLGANSLKEHAHTDLLFLWKGIVYVGEAKFIKKGGQSEGQAVDNALKVLRYARLTLAKDAPRPFVLFNQRVSEKYVRFLNDLNILVVVKNREGYEAQGEILKGLF